MIIFRYNWYFTKSLCISSYFSTYILQKLHPWIIITYMGLYFWKNHDGTPIFRKESFRSNFNPILPKELSLSLSWGSILSSIRTLRFISSHWKSGCLHDRINGDSGDYTILWWLPFHMRYPSCNIRVMQITDYWYLILSSTSSRIEKYSVDFRIVCLGCIHSIWLYVPLIEPLFMNSPSSLPSSYSTDLLSKSGRFPEILRVLPNFHTLPTEIFFRVYWTLHTYICIYLDRWMAITSEITNFEFSHRGISDLIFLGKI